MNETELSPLEKQIAKKIKRTKPKSEQKGYLRKLVDSLYTHIEDALSNGCEYDDIAESISETKIQITALTLKQYHLANRRQRKKDNQKNKDRENENSRTKQSQTRTSSEQSNSLDYDEQMLGSKAQNETKELSQLEKGQSLDTSSPLPSDLIPGERFDEVANNQSSISNKKQAAIDKLFSRK